MILNQTYITIFFCKNLLKNFDTNFCEVVLLNFFLPSSITFSEITPALALKKFSIIIYVI